MRWCGYLGTAGGGFLWLVPLIGLVFMGVMFFVCLRGSGGMGRRRRASGELWDLQQHEVKSSKESVPGSRQ